MPSYRYRAVNAQGRVARGRIAAANESELAQHLGSSGLELIEAHAKTETPHTPDAARIGRMSWPKRFSPRALPMLCAQMNDLLRAGVTFTDALRDIIDAAEPRSIRDALTDIARAINHGSCIADAFTRHPRLFSPVFIAILTAGEASGDLPGTFARLARYTENRAHNRERTTRALRYPLFLLLVAVATVTFMMMLVVPQISLFLASIDSTLPLMTRILIATSSVVADGWWIALLGMSVSLILLSLLRKNSERAVNAIDDAMLRVPVAGSMLQKIALARFMQSFAVLYESNVGIMTSLRNARATLGNRALEMMIDEAERQILSGRSLSAAMEGLLPPFALRIIRIGERSGTLAKSLYNIAEMQEREASAMIERLIGSLEPALTLTVGALFAWIVLAVLGPIYSSLSKLSGM